MNSGGAANQLGVGYQDRVAAWLCVRILAEQEANPLWEWTPDTTLKYLRCETEHPIDDIMVGTSHDGLALINVKHSLVASQAKDSDFASVLCQFVRQFIASRQQTKGEHPFNPDRDRFVLITSSQSSKAIRKDLRTVLERMRLGQSLDKAALTFKETEILEKVKTHIENAWLKTIGNQPTEEELVELLRFVRVEVLDVDDGETHECWAKDRLRSSVLQNPEQADVAWNTLIQTCWGWAKAHNGGAREHLQRRLLQEGIALKSPPSFHKDIEQLKKYSDRIFSLLHPLSQIEIQGKIIKIDRPVMQDVRKAAEQKSFVVMGKPGAGKSGVLHDLVETLKQENRDFVFLAVDKLESQSLSGLQRELHLDHDFLEVLRNWVGTEPGFLIIDALDAARDPATAQAFYDLLSLILKESTRWRVITSIRQYDLRHNTKLQALFNGQPLSEFHSNEFPFLRHIEVTELNTNEWQQIANQSAELGSLFIQADVSLKELMLTPFNVRLLAELLDRGIAIEQLTLIRAQIKLLDLYWEERVCKPSEEKDAHEILLVRASEEMVKARSLRVHRRDVATSTGDSHILKDILSSNILSEWQFDPSGAVNDRILTFAHHVLFDYAVARLLLRSEPEELIKRLENEPEFVMTIRPSLLMHFEYERLQGLKRFWDIVFSFIKSDKIPEIGKLIGPSVAVNSAGEIEDFSPLIDALNSTESSRRECAEKALRHVSGALMVRASIELITGTNALNWCELLDRCTGEPRVTTLYPSRPVLHIICDHPDLLTDDQRQSAGIVARRLLNFALSQENRDSFLVISGIETVCRTYESNADASGAILRRCLEPEHVLQYGHEELFRLANEIDRLISLAPDLVADIYRAAFTLNDLSEEKTEMGASRIMSLASTRRQDFQSSRWTLSQKYERFLNHAPLYALGVLIEALTGYIEEHHSLRHFGEYPEESFDFNGRQAVIKEDGSAIWDAGGVHRNDEVMRMFDSFQNYLETISADNEKQDERNRIVARIVEENRASMIWRRLLIMATRHPQTLGREIRYLCWALPILTCDDTRQPVGELLKVIFQLLTAEERQRVEKAILSIPDLVEEKRRVYAERRRNALLGCLDFESLVTDEAKSILAALRNSNNVPSNEPLYTSPEFTSREWTTADALREKGISLEKEANQRVLALIDAAIDAAKAFASKFLNETPSIEEIQEIIPILRLLHDALLESGDDACDDRMRDEMWGYLAEACASIAKSEAFNCEFSDAEFIKTTLLEAANYSDPLPAEDYKHFDTHPSWGSAARIDAAKGVMNLARKDFCIDEKLLQTIEKLANDPVPPVGFQIATRLVSLYYTAPDLMWSLIEKFSREENSRGVLHGLLYGTLDQLAGHHPDRVSDLARIIFERVHDGDGADKVRRNCTGIFVGLYVWQNHSLCHEVVSSMANAPVSHITEAHQIVGYLRDLLNLGIAEPDNVEQSEVRSRSFDLMRHVLESTLKQTREFEAKYNTQKWGNEDGEKLRELVNLADSICMQIYFASGAFRDNGNEEKVPRGVAERIRFWEQSQSILELLSEFGYARVTHYLLETLEYLIPFAPEAVFLMIGKVVRKGKEGGYQYESLAIDLIVRLVERFIAEYRHVLQNNENCQRALIEILDIFIDAGWPNARRLTYRLEEIFR